MCIRYSPHGHSAGPPHLHTQSSCPYTYPTHTISCNYLSTACPSLLIDCLSLLIDCLALFTAFLALFIDCLTLSTACPSLFIDCPSLFIDCLPLFIDCLPLFIDCLPLFISHPQSTTLHGAVNSSGCAHTASYFIPSHHKVAPTLCSELDPLRVQVGLISACVHNTCTREQSAAVSTNPASLPTIYVPTKPPPITGSHAAKFLSSPVMSDRRQEVPPRAKNPGCVCLHSAPTRHIWADAGSPQVCTNLS